MFISQLIISFQQGLNRMKQHVRQSASSFQSTTGEWVLVSCTAPNVRLGQVEKLSPEQLPRMTDVLSLPATNGR
jgi:hypothetical protein